MKSLFKILFLVFISTALFGCGNATEVGNPTGDVPELTILKGVIDTSTIGEGVSTSLLTVVALSDDGITEESAVMPDGSFTLDLTSGKTYSMEVRAVNEVIGPFSFEQDEQGNRGNSLTISEGGEVVDMGRVRFEGGAFYPESEPRRQMGNGHMGNN